MPGPGRTSPPHGGQFSDRFPQTVRELSSTRSVRNGYRTSSPLATQAEGASIANEFINLNIGYGDCLHISHEGSIVVDGGLSDLEALELLVPTTHPMSSPELGRKLSKTGLSDSTWAAPMLPERVIKRKKIVQGKKRKKKRRLLKQSNRKRGT